jgi:hypothetical protein
MPPNTFQTPPRVNRCLNASMNQAFVDLATEDSDATSMSDEVGAPVELFSDMELFEKRVVTFLDPCRPKRGTKTRKNFVASTGLGLKQKMLPIKESENKIAKKRRASMMENFAVSRRTLTEVNAYKNYVTATSNHMNDLDTEVTNNERSVYVAMQTAALSDENLEREILDYQNHTKNQDRTIMLLDKDRAEGMELVGDLNKKVVELQESLSESEEMSRKRLQALAMFTNVTKPMYCDICSHTVGYGRRVFYKTMCNHILCNHCSGRGTDCFWNTCVKRNAAGDIIYDVDGLSERAQCHYKYKLPATSVLDDIYDACKLIDQEFQADVGARLDETNEPPILISDFQENIANIRSAAFRAPDEPL